MCCSWLWTNKMFEYAAKRSKRQGKMDAVYCLRRPSHGSVNLSVCSQHFKDDCFENNSQYDAGFARKLLLKDQAVPTILGPTMTPQTVSNVFHLKTTFSQ
ncbi:hypothetical protein PO909_005866 [Leuciscus waleckii]